MPFFEYAQDVYGGWLPVKLLLGAGFLLVLLAALFAGVHLLRRSAGQPAATEAPEETVPGGRVRKYAWTARLYHWGTGRRKRSSKENHSRRS